MIKRFTQQRLRSPITTCFDGGTKKEIARGYFATNSDGATSRARLGDDLERRTALDEVAGALALNHDAPFARVTYIFRLHKIKFAVLS